MNTYLATAKINSCNAMRNQIIIKKNKDAIFYEWRQHCFNISITRIIKNDCQ